MRPRTVDQICGQRELLGPGRPLRVAIEKDNLRSAIFWGPPGCGKSTVASVIAHTTSATFVDFSAVTGGVADVRKIIDTAKQRRQATSRRTLLFVDEIHRFNKAQQDAFLPFVEDGTIVLIGATTENPYFSVNAPLLSRARVFPFQPLETSDISALLERAANEPERGLSGRVMLDPDALRFLAAAAGGDARAALGMLESAASLLENGEGLVDVSLAEAAVGRKAIGYDKSGDNHYDTVSAMIKSIRGSDPDAALYYLARMLEAGEDPRFLARRLVILASEDIGCADTQALPLAVACFQAVQFIGMPECALNLAHVATYLAAAPKSNATTVAIGRARDDVRNAEFSGIPAHLRDAHYQGAKALGHGADYRYPHDFPGGFVEQRYLPDCLPTRRYYEPTTNGTEARIGERLFRLWRNGNTDEHAS
jgi:putative ATPase